MIQHVKRLGLVVGLSMFSLLACAPASAQGTDAGTPASDAGTAAKAGDTPAKAEEGAKGGGRCTGTSTLCAVYSEMFCSTQPGCSYSYARRACGGLALKCETATNQAFCQKIKGCSWK